MPITYDNSASYDNGDATGTSITLSFTIGSGSNRILIVAVNHLTSDTTSGVTYNGVAMTQLGSVHEGITLWYMLESQLPTTGAYNIVASFTSSRPVIVALSLANVYQAAPETPSQNSTDTIDLTTNYSNSWVISVNGHNTGSNVTFTVTVSAGMTERQEVTNNAASASVGLALATYPTTTAGIYTNTFTPNNTAGNRIRAFEVREITTETGANFLIMF